VIKKIPDLDGYINESAEYLIEKINDDYGWGLNIEKGMQASSIVNTAEALFVIMHSKIKFQYTGKTRKFLLKALESHPKERGCRTRYFSFGLFGLYELGFKDTPIIEKYITELENLVIGDFGWPEETSEKKINLFETLMVTIAITQYRGSEYLNKKFPKWKQTIVGLRNQEGLWGFCDKGDTSVAAVSYVNLIYSIMDSKNSLISEMRESLCAKIKELLYNDKLLEIQPIHGTDWHHYTYAWGIKSLLYSKPIIDDQIEELLVFSLNKISNLFKRNYGFTEPYKNLCNVRSIFNNVIALCAIKNYFDLSHYLYLSKGRYEIDPKKIFIVHGSDNESKLELARFLERIGLEPIILHEQPDIGSTIIEKLERYSDVGFCFVLLTPDDVGYKKDASQKKQCRARQNVIFEMGLFTGKLGRSRVRCLYKGELELPSDYHGIIYLKYNESIKEKEVDIIKELSASGYKINIK